MAIPKNISASPVIIPTKFSVLGVNFFFSLLEKYIFKISTQNIVDKVIPK